MALKLAKKTKPKKIVKKATSPAAAARSEAEVVKPVMTGRYTEGVGRRKVAIARVRLYEQPAGEFLVNGLPAGKYFATVANASSHYLQPLTIVGAQGTLAVSAKVSGSGVRAQLAAVSHGLARALIEHNVEWRALLKPAKLLTRDDRMKETRKIGMGGKARRARQSPKR